MLSLKKFSKYLFLVIFVCLVRPAFAQENLGTLKLDRLLLEPTYSTDQRTYYQGFSIGRSFLGATWALDNAVSAKILFGSKFMIFKPARYSTLNPRELGIVEAYGELDTGLGVFRAGLVPIPFGFYSLKDESQQNFPNDLFVQSAFLQKRDYGVSYYISNDDFRTTFAVHNGESDVDDDQRYWMTGRWSYLGPAGGEYGFSGSTGRWLDTSSMREQKIRMGNAFAGFKLYGLGLAAEANVISIFENDVFLRQGYNWHVDLEHPLSPDVAMQLRYDFLEPHHSVLNDQVRELTYGLNYHTSYRNSVLFVLGTTRWEEGVLEPHSSLMVVWKLTPLTQQ